MPRKATRGTHFTLVKRNLPIRTTDITRGIDYEEAIEAAAAVDVVVAVVMEDAAVVLLANATTVANPATIDGIVVHRGEGGIYI